MNYKLKYLKYKKKYLILKKQLGGNYSLKSRRKKLNPHANCVEKITKDKLDGYLANCSTYNSIDLGPDIDDNDITKIFKNNPNIKFLNMDDCTNITDASFKHFKNLFRLSMVNCIQITNQAIIDNLSNLRELDVTGCKKLVDAPFRYLINLEKLNISNCDNLTDTILGIIAVRIKKLKQLIMRNCSTKFNVTGFHYLFLKEPPLECIDLDECQPNLFSQNKYILNTFLDHGTKIKFNGIIIDNIEKLSMSLSLP